MIVCVSIRECMLYNINYLDLDVPMQGESAVRAKTKRYSNCIFYNNIINHGFLESLSTVISIIIGLYGPVRSVRMNNI